MQTIIFAGPYGTPFSARYGFVMSRDAGGFQTVTIVVVQPKDDEQMSLISSRDSRDAVLNRILKNDLEGVRAEYIRFVVIVELTDRFEGWEIPLKLDVADFQAKGNPVEIEVDRANGTQTATYHSAHVVAGCAKFGAPMDGSKRIADEEPVHDGALGCGAALWVLPSPADGLDDHRGGMDPRWWPRSMACRQPPSTAPCTRFSGRLNPVQL